MSEIGTGTPVEERPGPVNEASREYSHEQTGPKRLYRSRQDRMIAGVCGGLGHYFNIDPVIVRLVFLVLLFSGPGILAYLVLAVVVPERPLGESEPAITSTLTVGNGREWVALALIAGGLLIMASNLRVLQFIDWNLIWPAVLILAGIAILFNHSRG